MARQVEFANDFRPQEGNDVGSHRKLEAREYLFRDCGPAEDVSPLQDENLLARPSEVRGVHKAVVTTADDHDVIVRIHEISIVMLSLPAGSSTF